MTISLISLDNTNEKTVDTFLKSLQSQDNQDFEVIICLNKKTEAKKIFKVIQSYKSFFGTRLVVIYNSKINNFQHNLISAFRVIKGDYFTVLNSTTNLKRYHISTLIKEVKEQSADVIEFKPRIIGSIKWKPAKRLEAEKEMKIANNQQILAYTFPMIFNKVFKTSLAKKLMKYKVENKNDTKFCLEVMYMLMFEAKKYIYLDYRIFKENLGSDVWLVSNHFLRTFNLLISYLKNSNIKLTQELTYAKYYFLKLILSGILSGTTFAYKNIWSEKNEISEKRSQLLIDKHFKLIQELESNNEFQVFTASNLYMNVVNNEVKALKNNWKNKQSKILSSLE